MTIDIYIHEQHPLRTVIRDAVLNTIAMAGGHIVAEGYYPRGSNIFARNLPDDFLSRMTPYAVKYGFAVEKYIPLSERSPDDIQEMVEQLSDITDN